MAQKTKILVIDDDRDLRYSLTRVLTSHGFEVEEADSGEAALKVVEKIRPHVILLDNRMEGMSGIETLQHLRSKHPDGLTILMTGYGTTQTTIEAMKYGAFDYVMKPFDLAKIISLVTRAAQALEEQDKARAAADADPSQSDANFQKRRESIELESREAGIVGNSEAMQTVIKTIGQVAASDVTVLITGESGTGKELVARQLHRHSLRVREKFIAVNCAAIPENLIESELFGHEKGAFTGAAALKLGKFELCDKGTIFLDEIGDMALTTQTKILRALQEGEIQRVGGTENIKVNVRLVAATNKNLEKMVAEKTFRDDLYYRLNVIRLKLPPLRNRKEDIPLLVDFMFHRLALRKPKAKAKRLSPEALAVLAGYEWPGNVRELENAMQRALIVARGETVMSSDLPPEILERSRAASGAAAATAGATAAGALSSAADTGVSTFQERAKERTQGDVHENDDAAAGAAAKTSSGASFSTPEAAAPSPSSAEGKFENSPFKHIRVKKNTSGIIDANTYPPLSPQEETDFFDRLYSLLRRKSESNILFNVEVQMIYRALRETKEHQVKSAQLLGINRATIKKRLEEAAAAASQA